MPTNHTPADGGSIIRYRRKADDKVPRWWAMSATFNRSMQAKRLLDAMSEENFLPMRMEVKTVGRRKVRRMVPAVSNLIFIRCTEAHIQDVKDQIDYLQFMCLHEDGRRRRITVPDKQMDDFRKLMSDQTGDTLVFSPDEEGLEKGDRVRIHGGPFDGVEGTFVKVAGKRRKMVVVTIPTLLSVATLSFMPDMLEKLKDDN